MGTVRSSGGVAGERRARRTGVGERPEREGRQKAAPRARGPKRHVRWGVFACAQDALGLCVGADALRTSKSASTAALASCVLRW